MAQWHATIGGQRYGPVDEETLRSWVREGRVTAADLVWSEGMAEWAPAGQIASLFPASAGSPGAEPPLPGMRPAPMVGSYMKPHRGAAVLTLGILAIPCCGLIFGIIAWVMGNNDLRDMDSGLMDPSGRGMTNAGRICGIVGLCLWGAGIVLRIVMAIALGGFAGFDAMHHMHHF